MYLCIFICKSGINQLCSNIGEKYVKIFRWQPCVKFNNTRMIQQYGTG